MKKMLLAALVASLPMAASANWLIGVDYARVTDEEVDLDALILNAGYQYDFQNGFMLIPALHLGYGVNDDSVGSVDVEIKSLYGFEIRGQFNFEHGAYLYLAPRYTNFDLELDFGDRRESEDDWEFGAAVGLGYNFSDAVAVELGFASYEDPDQWSLGLRFNF